MNKSEAFSSLKVLLGRLYRFQSHLSDDQATLILYSKITGFIDCLFVTGLISVDGHRALYELAGNVYQNARRAQ